MSGRNLIQNVYLFKGMTGEEMAVVNAIAELKVYAPTDDIFMQVEKASALYVIKYGSVRIHQLSKSNENIEVAILGTGSHFGEMAFVDSEPRSASATAIEKSEIVVLPYDKLKQCLDKNLTVAVKFYRELSHFLCGRLRVTTNDLSFSREKNLSHF